MNKRATPRKSKRRAAAKPMPPEALDFMRKFREWQDSFETPEKRMAYIQALCQRIAEEFKPEKIILFGSHAYGTPTPESDLDLLVVMPFESGTFEQSSRIRRRLGLVLPLDLLVRTPAGLQQRLQMGDLFIREILQQGKIIYEAHHA